MEVIAPIGVRIAQARREKGLTQDQLAAATHFSVSLVRHIEQGNRSASHAFTTAAARELGVQLGWLLGQEHVHRQHHEDDSTVAPALRAAMDAYDDPQLTGDVRPLSDLESVFASAERLWRAGRYDRLTMVLPELLRHLYSHAQDGTPGTEHAERTHALLADTYSAVQAAAGRYGCTDLIGMAIERHLAAAAASGDPLRPAVAAFRRSQLQMRWGHFDTAFRSLQRAERGIAELSGERADAVRVQLQLRQAVVCARQGDRDSADTLVTEARTRTRSHRLPGHPYPNVIASALNADMHWMAVAMETRDGTTALVRAREVTTLPSGPTDRNRNASWWVDLAQAYLLHGDRARCLDALQRARAASPQWVRYHPAVHETLATLARTDARRTASLSDLAIWVGVAR
jgi:transcriptional regulator with XRE-family HTH domain